jgi:AraC-like DNA-binding protein
MSRRDIRQSATTESRRASLIVARQSPEFRGGDGVACRVGLPEAEAGQLYRIILWHGTDNVAGGFVRPRPTRFLTLFVRRRQLAATTVNPQDSLARPIPDTEVLRLLVDYVETALRRQPPTSPELRQLFATHVQDLIALAVGPTRETGEAARGRGVRMARLSAIKGDIMRQLYNEGLCVAETAVRRGVTPRYVQMLFESEGTTFTQYVLEQRLARALQMLADPQHRGQAISAIAFEAGFGNLSYFNRAFRRRFGMTPSDARHTIG